MTRHDRRCAETAGGPPRCVTPINPQRRTPNRHNVPRPMNQHGAATSPYSGRRSCTRRPEPHKIAQATPEQTDPDKRKPQLSIRKLLLWTAIVSVGLMVTTVTLSLANNGLDALLATFNLSIYIMAVCGQWTLIENPKSFDFWFPAGMTVFLPVFFLLYAVGIPRIPGQIGDTLLEIISTIILLASSPKTDPVGVRESFRAAGPERILLDESETTYGGSDHYEVASSGCSSRQGHEGARGLQAAGDC